MISLLMLLRQMPVLLDQISDFKCQVSDNIPFHECFVYEAVNIEE